MKIFSLVLIASLTAAVATAGSLSGSVDLTVHADGLSLSSYGEARWDPCDYSRLHCVYGTTFTGSHVISFDGGPAGVIGYRWIEPTNDYSEYVESVPGNCSAFYRARVSAQMSSGYEGFSNAWGSIQVRTDECDGPWGTYDPGDNQSPIVIDLDRNADPALSGPRHPVYFDILADGNPRPISWTHRRSRTGFLALDRNHNGTIDDGAELFGNHTPFADGRPPGPDSNGYVALEGYDSTQFGGNGDGRISREDAIWPDLRLWIDGNRDGISQRDELFTMEEAGIVELGLDYSFEDRKDSFGNLLRFQSYAVVATALGERTRIPTWDVFFVSADDGR